MILEHYRDRPLLKLYTMLTRSDLAGELEDEYVICVLYALRCIDVNRKLYDSKGGQIVLLAKEAVRICDGEDPIPIDLGVRGLLKYMKEDGLSVKQIHRMSTCDLKRNVERKMREEDEYYEYQEDLDH